MSINYVQLTGNMLQPELRQTQTGKTVMSASMVIKGYGESAEDMWVDIQAWENLAKNISVCLDYQNVGSVNYAGDGNNASTGGNYQTPAQHSSQTNPVARPLSDVAEGEAPF